VSKPGTLDEFNFTLANTLPTMRWTHTSDANLFQLGSSVSIVFGYGDELQPMIDGEITQITPTFPSSGVPTVAIHGQTLLHRLGDNTRPRTFQKMTDTEMAQQISQDAKIEFQGDDSEIQYDYVSKGNKSDLAFLKERADRIHFEISMKENKLRFRRAQESKPEAYTLVWSQIQKGFSLDNTRPLKSFNPQLDSSQPATHVEYRAYDVKSKQAFVCRADSGDQILMGGSQKAGDVVAASRRERPYIQVAIPFTSQAQGDRYARAAYNQRALTLVGGSGDTIGTPELRSGKVIDLQGLGPLFSGRYYIEEATHTIDGNGYQTSFSAKRNAKNES
jgi:phage protein D